ncbi:hypothetical protein GIB67_006049 [Kingdonia uniflora]|uniref:Uncharacterized protein n=1 Tax=Kingdonia uniflora TaxID=39325 RepID=A0A7J7LPK2_9MAGN|nr:hypothetical protein GIB67_006049 [Kingdonia uniflora]
MGVQDKSEGTVSNTIVMGDNRVCLDVGGQSAPATQLKESCLSADEHTLKARKPYTITKQRERWTEEEHTKFLEALKLYGRAWRRIEEHVGSKTAVQIRSHAQKFFSKVIKETNNTVSSEKPIEIPPPRPKRKPMHPYPRKHVESNQKHFLVTELPERSSSLNISITDKETESPTSVLSATGSDTMGSLVSSEKPDNLLPSEEEKIYYTSFVDEESRSSSCSVLVDQANMKSDFASNEERSTAEAPITCLKLFGKTVMVTDSHRPLSVKSETANCRGENSGANEGNNQTQNGFVTDFASRSAWTSWPCGGQNLMEGGFTAPLPWWPIYGGLPFRFYPSLNLSSAHMHPEFTTEEGTELKERQTPNKEGSCSDSNTETASGSAEGITEKRGDVVDSQRQEPSSEKISSSGFQRKHSERSAFSQLRTNPEKCSKGFVPYKRCFTERDTNSSGTAGEEREGKRIRLCL